MKYNCDVIKDLLPLYHDEVCSEASKEVVEEHLKECISCKEILQKLKNTVYEDILEEQSHDIIKTHERKEQKYSFIVGATIAGILLIPVVVCLICNLVAGHALDWFFIVLTSLMIVASVTVVPLISTEKRLLKAVVSFTLSLILLLLTCCIYTKGNWLFVATVPILFGMSLIFTPIFLYQCNVPIWIKKHKGLVSMMIDTLLLYAVIVVCGLYAQVTDYWRISFSITSVCIIAPWFIFLIIRYLKSNIMIKTGLCIIILGCFTSTINLFIAYVLPDSETINMALNIAIGISMLVGGCILLIIGCFIKKGKK